MASGEARRVAHLEGDSPRRGAHRGWLGVSKHGSILLAGERTARLPVTEDHPGVSNREWQRRGNDGLKLSAGHIFIFIFFCRINNLFWIHVHVAFFLVLFVCSYYQNKLASEGGRRGLTFFSFFSQPVYCKKAAIWDSRVIRRVRAGVDRRQTGCEEDLD